jgi:hypothetical protein
MSVYHPPDPYQDCICDDCPRCGAEAGVRCRNPQTEKQAHCPCIARLKPVPA